MVLITQSGSQDQPVFAYLQPAVYVSLEAIRKAAPGSISAWHTIVAILGTLKQYILSLFTDSAKKLTHQLSFNHPYFPVIANLDAKGHQLKNGTIVAYLELKKCSFVSTFLYPEGKGVQKALAAALATNQPFSIPVIVKGIIGNHIVNLRCLKNAEGTIDVEFFDSKGLSLNHPNNHKALEALTHLEKLVPLGNITQLVTEPLQSDSHSCGVFVAWHATEGGGYLPLEIETFRAEMARDLIANAPNIVVAPERADAEMDSDSDDF